MLVNEVRISCVRRLEQAALSNSFDRDFYHLFFVLEGNGSLMIDGSFRRIKENDCLLLNDFTNIVIVPEQGESICLVQIVLTVLHKELATELSKCQEKLDIPSQVSRALILRIWSYSNLKLPYYEDSVNLLVMSLLLAGISGKNPDKAREPGTSVVVIPSNYDKYLNSMIKYIEEHISEDISISELASLVNMTPKQINRIFKQQFGLTPMQYVNNMRLSKSKELLVYSSYNITEIAELTGFKSIHYFSRFFKEKEKISPLVYKETMKCQSFVAV